MIKKLFERVKKLGEEERNEVHIHDMTSMDEMNIEYYHVYLEGYAFQISHNKGYDKEFSSDPEYDFYAEWDCFKTGLTVELAYDFILPIYKNYFPDIQNKKKEPIKPRVFSTCDIEIIPITEGNGEWFDLNKAQCYEGKKWWNGNNHISCSTGSQHSNENLYCTPHGQWIKECTNEAMNTKTSYFKISIHDAALWLMQNDHIPTSNMGNVVSGLEIL